MTTKYMTRSKGGEEGLPLGSQFEGIQSVVLVEE